MELFDLSEVAFAATASDAHTAADVFAYADAPTAASAAADKESLLDLRVALEADVPAKIRDDAATKVRKADAVKSLMDADTIINPKKLTAEAESKQARLQAVKAQQATGVQSLQLAQQAPSTVLSLLR